MNEEKINRSKIAEREEKILKFWRDNKIFEKSVEKPAPNGKFTFYDGPPFANGTPHYGHLLAGTIKDVVPRFWTMRGFRVTRRWGWDCHGLPVENLVEKELELKSKKDIENYGVEKFNVAARQSVLRYTDIWRQQIPRLGRFVDMTDDYRTMDANYTESVWWAFKKLYDKGLIYEGFKSMHLCPHCGTTLSNFEVAQGYKDIKDISVYVKFKLKAQSAKFKIEDSTYLLAWTTTPWTLPGNVALAVGRNIDYVKVQVGEEKLILAKVRLSVLKQEYKILEEFKGEKLVGLSYQPLFDYYKNLTLKDIRGKDITDITPVWKIFGADFVTTENGTGIVHIAPAFGEDDYQLAGREDLPFIQHVGTDGKFKKEVSDFVGMEVKPKDDPTRADVAVLKFLAARNLLFEKEKITHSYPHCWRCESPLLNYAASSWFVKVTNLKNKLIAENKKINWVPEAIGKYRFGNWLTEARDWAISRSRFWGAPLPVWRCDKCKKTEIIGSIADIKKHLKPRNRYFVMRHGEAENNIAKIMSTKPENPHHLTEKGKEQVRSAAIILKKEKIDLIYVSPFVRTKESAEIVRQALGLGAEQIIVDAQLSEISAHDFNSKPVSEFQAAFSSLANRFSKRVGGENYTEIKNRVGKFLYEIDVKNFGKNILVVSHEAPIWLLTCAAAALSEKLAINSYPSDFPERDFLRNAEVKDFNFIPLPRNENYELDLHRPFIDSIQFDCPCGGKMKRISEVFDCWFESGSMPFAEWHYPFDSVQDRPFEKVFNPKPGWFQKPIGFPADFIAEGLDQTRGWFYSMLVLGVALFDKAPYKNVIVNGTMLTESGEKMSKRLKNYPDPINLVDKYSADAIRYYMLASPVVRAEDYCFSEKGVDEVAKKVLGRLDNVLNFYLLYVDKNLISNSQFIISDHVLDKWVTEKLNQLINEVTAAMESYELDKAARPIANFIDDLSTWYLRRSRERIKSGDEDGRAALQTLRFVLLELAKVMAPFTPFFAEYLYKQVGDNPKAIEALGLKESVHLENWPEINEKLKAQNEKLIEEMKEVRRIVSLALEARAKVNIKVRQPLGSVKLKAQNEKLKEEFLELIRDEVNVKEIVFGNKISNEVELDTNITPELKKEGDYREVLRRIQELRKEKGLQPGQLATLATSAQIAATGLLQDYETDLKNVAALEKINHGVLSVGDFELR